MRKARMARGWTLVQLGQVCGLHPRYLGLVEMGANDASLSTVVAICHALAADIGEIMREVVAVHAPRGRK